MALAATSQRILLYAMGGGLGHFTRSAALARALRKARPADEAAQLFLMTNCRLARSAEGQAELAGVNLYFVDDSARDVKRTREAVNEVIDKVQPDVFIVDSFPRGLGGELCGFLETTNAFRILTQRDLDPRYIERFQLARFVANHYDLVLSPGESSSMGTSAAPRVTTAPWLIRDDNELASRVDARSRLQAAHLSQPLVAVLAAGKPDEAQCFADVATQLAASPVIRNLKAEVRLFHPPGTALVAAPRTQALWPILPWIRAIDVVVGAGGYNTVHEMRATKTPHVGLAQPRLYDRQELRLQQAECTTNPEDLAGLAEACLLRRRSSESKQGRRIEYPNGAHRAAHAILHLACGRTAKLAETLL